MDLEFYLYKSDELRVSLLIPNDGTQKMRTRRFSVSTPPQKGGLNKSVLHIRK